MVDERRITYKELIMINDVMPNLSLSGLGKLESRFKLFLETITQKAN